jgi:hypothetical protein
MSVAGEAVLALGAIKHQNQPGSSYCGVPRPGWAPLLPLRGLIHSTGRMRPTEPRHVAYADADLDGCGMQAGGCQGESTTAGTTLGGRG